MAGVLLRHEDIDHLSFLSSKEKDKLKMVIDTLANNRKRESAPPAPEGGISLRAASRKYGIPNQTLSRWVKKGLIPTITRTRNELYADELALAEQAAEYLKNPGRGKWTIKKVADENRNNNK